MTKSIITSLVMRQWCVSTLQLTGQAKYCPCACSLGLQAGFFCFVPSISNVLSGRLGAWPFSVKGESGQ